MSKDEWSKWYRYLAWRTKEELAQAGFDPDRTDPMRALHERQSWDDVDKKNQ